MRVIVLIVLFFSFTSIVYGSDDPRLARYTANASNPRSSDVRVAARAIEKMYEGNQEVLMKIIDKFQNRVISNTDASRIIAFLDGLKPREYRAISRLYFSESKHLQNLTKLATRKAKSLKILLGAILSATGLSEILGVEMVGTANASTQEITEAAVDTLHIVPVREILIGATNGVSDFFEIELSQPSRFDNTDRRHTVQMALYTDPVSKGSYSYEIK